MDGFAPAKLGKKGCAAHVFHERAGGGFVFVKGIKIFRRSDWIMLVGRDSFRYFHFFWEEIFCHLYVCA